MRIFLIITMLLIFSAPYAKNGTYNVDGPVWLVKTSGIWKNNNKYGYYRVIVTRKGREHGQDYVYVQILDNKLKIIKSLTLDTPGYKGYIKDVTFNNINNKKIAIGFEIIMKAMYGLTMKEIFIVTPEGTAEKIVNAKGLDL